MLLKPLLTTAGFVASAIPSVLAASSACTTHNIPISVENVPNFAFNPTLDLTSVAGVESVLSSGIGLVGQLLTDLLLTTSGSYYLAATYCPPAEDNSGPASRAKNLQVLLHGVPYNRTYWFGLPGNPDTDPDDDYNWVGYFTSQGYPILAVDNLGAGDSQRADPITEVQQPLQTALIHGLVELLRAGSLPGIPKPEKLIFVGHSLASVIGNAIATAWPSDFDAFVLTAYSYDLVPAAIGLLTEDLDVASLQNPTRHPAATYPPGYLAYNSSEGKRQTYYAEDGSFSPGVELYDYNVEDTISLGQIVTAFSGLQAAPNYMGSVFILTGEQDAFFCGPTGTREITQQECGLQPGNIVASSQSFFPNATNFYSYVVQDVAHAFNLHYAAYDSWAFVQLLLNKWGF